MPRERLYLFDTTLRDGAQTNGVDFTLHDKLAVAALLDDLGVDYVEGGYPGANPTDTELFGQDRNLKTTFTAFGMTRRPGRSASNDPGLKGLIDAKIVEQRRDGELVVQREVDAVGLGAVAQRGVEQIEAFARRLALQVTCHGASNT